jgi:transposase
MTGRPQKKPPTYIPGVVKPMEPLLTRYSIKILRQAGHTQDEVAKYTKVGLRTVQRIDRESPVKNLDDPAERKKRKIGRPSKTESFRIFIEDILKTDPDLMSLELFRRARELGYSGGKSAFFELAKSLRPKDPLYSMRFEGLPGEFSQHDFGQVDVVFLDGSETRIHFFASRLKWSCRWWPKIPQKRWSKIPHVN